MKKLLFLSALLLLACSSDLFAQDYMKMRKKQLRIEHQKKLKLIDSLSQELSLSNKKSQNLQSDLNNSSNDLTLTLDSLKNSNLQITQLEAKLLISKNELSLLGSEIDNLVKQNSDKNLQIDSLRTSLNIASDEKMVLVAQDSLNFFRKKISENKQLSKFRDSKSFETFLNYFLLTTYSEKNIDSLIYVSSSKIMQFTNRDIPLGRFYNLGAECNLYSEKEQFGFDFYDSYYGDVSPNVLGLTFFRGKEPNGGFCDEASTPNGIYFRQINDLPIYDSEMISSNKNYSIRNHLKDSFKVVVQIQFNYYISETLYFVYYKNKWVLLYINDCDCSA
jgi:hypothetical protein